MNETVGSERKVISAIIVILSGLHVFSKSGYPDTSFNIFT